MKSTEVTLVIPCYNAEETLPRVLEAVDQLDPGPAVVLCVDDGSEDRTREIVRENERAQLIAHDHNRGIGATINTGLSHVETPLFAKIDADIVVPSNWIELMITEMDRSSADFVQGRFVEEVTTSADQWRKEYPSPRFDKCPYWSKPINGATLLAATDALRNVGGWNEQYRRAFDDIDIMERLIEAGFDVYYTPRVQSTHIRTDTWSEVLRMSWAYSNHPDSGGEPSNATDILYRFPKHVIRFGKSVLTEGRHARVRLLWISVLQLFFHIKWDIECALQPNDPTTDSPLAGEQSRSHVTEPEAQQTE
ncbi:glycosyltransferase [Natrialbaceae archaeon A-arb3/5]